MVRESSAVMLGHYFKRRRQFVEMITMSGEGVGVALFSVILKEGVGYVYISICFSFFLFLPCIQISYSSETLYNFLLK